MTNRLKVGDICVIDDDGNPFRRWIGVYAHDSGERKCVETCTVVLVLRLESNMVPYVKCLLPDMTVVSVYKKYCHPVR